MRIVSGVHEVAKVEVEARQVISLMSEQLGEPMDAINPYHFTNGAT